MGNVTEALQLHNIQITNKRHFNVYYFFYSQCSHQYVLAATMAIFKVMLSQEHKDTNVVSCVTVTS